MATANADDTIEALLERRAQYEQWLARLDSTADKAPTAVRDRVRGDYEARLRGVIDELRGHEATIRQELEQHRATQTRLSTERRTVEEALAEAELRHAVGEYAEEEWQRLSGESQRQLDQLRGELDAVGREIARLAEVQAIIGGPSAPRQAAEPAPAPALPVEALEPIAPSLFNTPAPAADEPAPVEERAPVEPVRVEPRMVEPTPAPEPVSPPPPALDELAFLKSVSDEDHRPAAPSRRPSGGGSVAAPPKQVETAPAAPTPVASPPAPAPTPVGTAATTGATTGGAAAGGATKAAGMAKTLKCTECGTLNRPTEWYCERCGAELAAL